MPPHLICFDLGNVLVRLSPSWQDAFARAGIEMPPQFDSGDVWDRHADLITAFETGRIDATSYCRRAGERLGIRGDHFAAVFDVWIDGMHRGIDELIHHLIHNRVKTACLSNTNERHWRSFADSNAGYAVLDGLDYQFASHLIGARKPDPAIYRHVEQHTGVNPESILFFDDHPPNVEAARRRGWRAEVIDPANDPAAQLTEYLLSSGALLKDER